MNVIGTEKIMDWYKKSMSENLYHGVENELSGQQIIADGSIKPGDLMVQRRGYLKPVVGRVYLAQDLKYAVIYTLGGDMLGIKLPESFISKSKYGYLFVLSGSDLKDPQPDEDEIGKLIWDGNDSGNCPSWLLNLATRYLTYNQYRKVNEGEYIYWANAGKKLVKLMSPSQKQELIDNYGVHVATLGEIPFRQAWKFDKTKNPTLKKDASNFFNLAERVK